MPSKDPDLSGQAPDRARAVLLLVDVISPFDFVGADDLLAHARPVYPRLVRLRERAREAGLPVVYANDHFGRWRDDFARVAARATAAGAPGRALVRTVLPEPDDYVVLKPRLSAFFGTPLELLLDHIGAETLVVAGLAADLCVLATAQDAHLRGLHVVIPDDTTASEKPTHLAAALAYARRAFDAATPPSGELDLAALLSGPPSP